MKVEIVKVGYLETNCYLLEKNGKVLVIDPGDEFYKIKDAIGEKKVIGVVITHYHDDHIGALKELIDEFDVNTYDVHNLIEGKCSIDEFEFECINTPGHKEDAISLYFEKEKMLFSGDFIFQGTIGRWDFPGGSTAEMKKSLLKIMKYPADLTVFPGHGDKTNLGDETLIFENYIKYF